MLLLRSKGLEKEVNLWEYPNEMGEAVLGGTPLSAGTMQQKPPAQMHREAHIEDTVEMSKVWVESRASQVRDRFCLQEV